MLRSEIILHEKERCNTMDLCAHGVLPFKLQDLPEEEMGFILSQIYDHPQLHKTFKRLFAAESAYRLQAKVVVRRCVALEDKPEIRMVAGNVYDLTDNGSDVDSDYVEVTTDTGNWLVEKKCVMLNGNASTTCQ